MSDRDAVLFANEAFYRAFADRDLPAMDRVWSQADDIVCIHPGWAPVEGRDQVMESWQAILGNPSSPAILCRGPRAWLRGEMAFVVCFEEIDGQFLLATNIFVHEGGIWRLVHHQAGPTNGVPEEEEVAEPTVN